MFAMEEEIPGQGLDAISLLVSSSSRAMCLLDDVCVVRGLVMNIISVFRVVFGGGKRWQAAVR